MKKNQLILSILLVGIAFGTAWAIRGQFGLIGGGLVGLSLAIILLLPLISQLMHGGIPNANMRFPLQP